MSDVTKQEIEDALERAQAPKEAAEEFIDIADGINNAERIKLEGERSIDIDSKGCIPLDDVTKQEIEDALERAHALKETAEEFIDIADGINNAERIRLEEERSIDIDSKGWIPLDDLPLGEEVVRVKGDKTCLDTAIEILEDLAEGKIPAPEVAETFQGAMEDLDAVESTLQDVDAEEVIKFSQAPDNGDFYHEQDDGECSEEGDE